MNKPNRKFSPKPSGGERSERPRRPRTNEGSRGAGFSDKRYSPMLDPDDNKEWQQRDKEGRRYRPDSDSTERTSRSRDSDSRGDGPRSSSPRREGTRGDAPRNSSPRSNDRNDFRKSGRDGDEGGSRFRTGGERSGRPRTGDSARPGSRPNRTDSGERSSFGGERSGFRRDNHNEGSSFRPSNYGSRREGSRGDAPRGYGEKPQYGNKPRFRDQDAEGGNRSSRGYSNRAEDGSSEKFGGPRRDSFRGDGPRGDSRREDGRSNFRSDRSEGLRTENRNTGRRGESRFEGPGAPRGNRREDGPRADSPRGGAPRGNRRSDDNDSGSEGRARSTPFKKKTLTDSKVSSTSTPPTYDFSKVRGKGPKVAHTDAIIRLNKYIADSGICSRRDADELIASGQIKVNGEVITQMGHKVSRSDSVTYNGRKINPEKLVYVLLNKPKDFITTTEDPHERRTVMELVSDAAEQRIYPVGRLDRNTTGLLLLTNDGELAEKLSHPSHKAKKVYQVLLDKPLTEEDLEKVQQGIVLEDGPAPVDEIGYVTPDKTVIGVEIHIGRNRIVRRIFESLGYEVLGLDRVTYASLTKKDLPRGHWRYLSEKEVIRLKHFS